MMNWILNSTETFVTQLSDDRKTVLEYEDPVIEDYLLELARSYRCIAWRVRAQLETGETCPHKTTHP